MKTKKKDFKKIKRPKLFQVLYPAAGGSDDWAHGGAGIPYSYTIELPDTGSYGYNITSRKYFEYQDQNISGSSSRPPGSGRSGRRPWGQLPPCWGISEPTGVEVEIVEWKDNSISVSGDAKLFYPSSLQLDNQMQMWDASIFEIIQTTPQSQLYKMFVEVLDAKPSFRIS